MDTTGTDDRFDEPPAVAALRAQLTASFTERCWATLREWTVGTSSRSTTLRKLHIDLESMADAEGSEGMEWPERLAAATGAAMAVACRLDDEDCDSSEDPRMVAEGVRTFKMWLGPGIRELVLGLAENDRRRMRTQFPQRVRASAAYLDDSAGDATNELAACTATAMALFTSTSDGGDGLPG